MEAEKAEREKEKEPPKKKQKQGRPKKPPQQDASQSIQRFILSRPNDSPEAGREVGPGRYGLNVDRSEPVDPELLGIQLNLPWVQSKADEISWPSTSGDAQHVRIESANT